MSADQEFKAKVGTREFTDRSWNGLVSRVAAAYKLDTTAGERILAADNLKEGYAARLDGVKIVPVRS